MLAKDLASVPSSPLSYSEDKAWKEFHHDRETFFKRGSLLAVPLPEDAAEDMRRLSDLVATVTHRHEILRTAFDDEGRHVLPHYEHEIRVVDAPLYPVDGLYPSHVMPEDLVRVFLAPNSEGGRTLYFDLNEMITDTGSTARLSEDVYQVLREGPASLGLPPMATYAQFAIEQRVEPLADRTLEFWKRALDGMGPDGNIPHEGPDPSGDTAGEQVLVLPDECTAGFRWLCQRHRMSPFMAVGALASVSLSALWDLADLTVTTAASTRPAKYRDVVGNFANNVLLRFAATPATTLAEAAEAARGTVMGALRHPAQIFKIAEAIGMPIQPPPIRIHYLASGAHYYKMLDTKPSGARWREPAEFPGWPLEIGFAEDSRKRVAIWMQYDPRRFHHDRVDQLIYCCQTLLEACAAGNDGIDVSWLRDRLADRGPALG